MEGGCLYMPSACLTLKVTPKFTRVTYSVCGRKVQVPLSLSAMVLLGSSLEVAPMPEGESLPRAGVIPA